MVGGTASPLVEPTPSPDRRTTLPLLSLVLPRSSYTGVYAKRFEGGEMGGRINDDVVNVSGVNRYTGSTTTAKTDGVVRDLSE